MVVSKGLHILLQAIMFSEAFTDLRLSFPISGSKYQNEKGKDITPLIKSFSFFFLIFTLPQLEITHFPKTTFIFYLERHFYTCRQDEGAVVLVYCYYFIY